MADEKQDRNIVAELTATTNVNPNIFKKGKQPIFSSEELQQASQITFTEDDILDFKASGIDLPDTLKPQNFNTAFEFIRRGVSANKLLVGTKHAAEKGVINEAGETSLYNTAYLVAVFEDFDPNLTKYAQYYGNPEVEFKPAPAEYQLPRNNQMLLQVQNNIISPIKQGASRLFGEVKSKLATKFKSFAKDALRKVGTKVAKALVKKIPELAIKIGLETAAAGATGGISLVIEAGRKLLSYAKKFGSFLMRKFKEWTGSRDTTEAIFKTGLVAAIGGTVIGSSAMTALGIAGTAVGGTGMAAKLVPNSIIGNARAVGQTFLATLPAYGKSIADSALIIILAIPLFVAFCIFIINSSAYMVPPGPDITSKFRTVGDLYIDVLKLPDEPGPHKNNITIAVNYTVTITAKKSVLEQLSFSDSCDIYTENGTPICPQPRNIEAGFQSGDKTSYDTIEEAIPETNVISPSDPYIITYTITYSGLTDALVVDSFDVSARTEGQDVTATGVADVIFGNPPTGCFVISPAANAWPGAYERNMQSAITSLVSGHPTFAVKACSGGTINLCYNPGAMDPGYWGRHLHASNCDIAFSSGGLTTESNALYILTHEVSHHLQAVQPSLQSAYESSGAIGELPLCSYSNTTSPAEGFAEGNALYVQLPSYWGARCGTGSTFQQLYPEHYQFAKRTVFFE